MNKKGRKSIGFDEAKVIVNEYSRHEKCDIPNNF